MKVLIFNAYPLPKEQFTGLEPQSFVLLSRELADIRLGDKLLNPILGPLKPVPDLLPPVHQVHLLCLNSQRGNESTREEFIDHEVHFHFLAKHLSPVSEARRLHQEANFDLVFVTGAGWNPVNQAMIQSFSQEPQRPKIIFRNHAEPFSGRDYTSLQGADLLITAWTHEVERFNLNVPVKYLPLGVHTDLLDQISPVASLRDRRPLSSPPSSTDISVDLLLVARSWVPIEGFNLAKSLDEELSKREFICRVTGDLPRETYYAILKKSRAVFFPTASESCARSITEAFAAGCHVIVEAHCQGNQVHAQTWGGEIINAGVEFDHSKGVYSFGRSIKEVGDEIEQILNKLPQGTSIHPVVAEELRETPYKIDLEVKELVKILEEVA